MSENLNVCFEEWVNEILLLVKKREILVKRIWILNNKLVSCKTVNYGILKVDGSGSNNNKIINSLISMEMVELKIKEIDKKLRSYNEFLLGLTEKERFVFESKYLKKVSIRHIAFELRLSRNRIHEICGSITNKFLKIVF